MSTSRFSFKVKLRFGRQIVPLASEVVLGDGEAEDGVENGFLFKLDLQPTDLPVVISLGDIIAFIQEKLDGGDLAKNPNLKLIEDASPEFVDKDKPFTPANGTQILVRSFILNSTTKEKLFSISVDLEGADPSEGLIPLPKEFASWLRIDNLAISFTAKSKS
jgi:hypothetical protein